MATFMAKQGANMQAIRDYIDANYYPMDFTLDGIRDSYMFKTKPVRIPYRRH